MPQTQDYPWKTVLQNAASCWKPLLRTKPQWPVAVNSLALCRVLPKVTWLCCRCISHLQEPEWELVHRHKLSFKKLLWPSPVEVPAAPEEPPSQHPPPPFSRTPAPTVFYLEKLLIQWMQLGWNSCTSGLFLPDRSLGHNTLLDKHWFFAGWTELLQKPLKNKR